MDGDAGGDRGCRSNARRHRKLARHHDPAVDILVVDREHAEARRHVPGSVIRAALKQGKVVVER